MRKITALICVLLMGVSTMGAQNILPRLKFAKPKAYTQVTANDTERVDFAYCPGAFYANNDGVGNYYFILTSVPSSYSAEDGSVTLEGAGWSMMLDLYGAPTSPIALPEGVYTASEGFEQGSFYPEYSYALYQNAQGEVAFYPVDNDITVSTTPSGLLMVETSIDVNGVDTKMVFTGQIEFSDTNSDDSVLPGFYENLDLDFNGSFAWYYGNLYEANTGNMLVNLYEGDYDKETGSHTGVGYCVQLCLYDVLFSNPKEAKVMPGTYKMERSFARDTFFPGMPIDYMGTTLIMGSFVQKHAADGSYSYAYISDGEVVIEETADGNLKFTLDLVTDHGYTVRGEYVGTVPVTDMSDDKRGAVISTLQEDYQLTLDSIPVARIWKQDDINGCGRFYMDIGSPSGLDEYVEKNGGDIFRIDMLTEQGAGMFSSGVYTVMEDKYDIYYAPFKLRRGFFEDGGDLRGTRWFHFKEGSYMVADGLAPAYAGTVSLQYKGNDVYHVVIDVYDDGGFNITGEWTGPVQYMFDVPTGIAQSMGEAEFTFIDNETILLGNVAQNEKIQLFNMSGQCVATHCGNGTISLAQLPKGIYLVKADNKKTFKVVKR